MVSLLISTGPVKLPWKKFSRTLSNGLTLNDSNLPIRLFPMDNDANKVIAIDPSIAFGRPFIVRKGISTIAIIDRLDANEEEDEIAKDYGLWPEEMKQAIVYEQAA